MTAALFALAVTALAALGVLSLAWLTDADAAQGPPPTLRPGADPGFDDGLEVDDLPLLDAAYLEHVAEALVLAQRDGVVVPMQRRPGGAS
jgi:hypothetical protein